MFSVSTNAIRAWMRAGKFPRPLPVSRGKYLWSREAVERVLEGDQGVGQGATEVSQGKC
jgi:hypothetical protein